MPHLVPEDYEKDEKARAVTLTEAGVNHVEELAREAELLKNGGLYDIANISVLHHVNQALRAHKLFQRDTDYIVKGGKVVIIDEFTGRMMEGRRYSDGLHQALEAKEAVEVQTENQTLASITFQNYFRMYPKLAGMTGTAMTEAEEFADIYKLEVVEIPTNLPCVRKDMDDEVYRTAREKNEAIIDTIMEAQARKQPVLVGTVSIEKSELLSEMLKKRKVPHQVLNARYHEQEAYIIAQAGRPGAVTIATNMAGRGTDIQLGGNVEMRVKQELGSIADESLHKAKEEEVRAEVARAKEIVIQAGGCFVVGTERHESRRIDNQLRGRSGRQGDPGASKFFLSLEDDLMRIFGSERMDGMLQKLGLKEGEAITHPWINKALEKAQQKVEARNFDIRKNLLRFDDVMNDQRKVIYEQRRELMQTDDVAQMVEDMRRDVIRTTVSRFIPEQFLSRAMGHQGPARGDVAPARPRTSLRRLGEGGGTFRQRGPRADREGLGRQDGREGRAVRPGDHAHGGEEHPSAAPRPGVEGPPPLPRPFAPGDRAPRLRPARSAHRVQARGLRALRGHARALAGDGDERALPARAAHPAARAADAPAAAAPAPGAARRARHVRRGAGDRHQWRAPAAGGPHPARQAAGPRGRASGAGPGVVRADRALDQSQRQHELG